MNSDKAAAVRDSVNGCPLVVGDEDVRETSETATNGDRTEPTRSRFRPAYIEQSGTVGNDDGREAPVYVVVLKTLWTEQGDVRSLSEEMVHEVAKHGCSLRFYPPGHRLAGDIWIVDHFTEDLSNTDGDRCPECESTYFKIRDGEPECARCGEVQTEAEQATLTEVA